MVVYGGLIVVLLWVYGGVLWFMMVNGSRYGGLRLFIMVYDGLWQFMVVYGGLHWFITVYCGL